MTQFDIRGYHDSLELLSRIGSDLDKALADASRGATAAGKAAELQFAKVTAAADTGRSRTAAAEKALAATLRRAPVSVPPTARHVGRVPTDWEPRIASAEHRLQELLQGISVLAMERAHGEARRSADDAARRMVEADRRRAVAEAQEQAALALQRKRFFKRALPVVVSVWMMPLLVWTVPGAFMSYEAGSDSAAVVLIVTIGLLLIAPMLAGAAMYSWGDWVGLCYYQRRYPTSRVTSQPPTLPRRVRWLQALVGMSPALLAFPLGTIVLTAGAYAIHNSID
jgi:hypothetical protein